MDVVSLHGNEVRGAEHENGPVVVAVAGSGPRGRAVKLRVGDCDAVGGAVAGYEHLAADERNLDVIWCVCLVVYDTEGREVPTDPD